MSEDLRNAVRHLVREMYRPFDEASDLVRCFGEAAMVVTDSSQAEIRVRLPAEPGDLTISLGSSGGRAKPFSGTPPWARFPIRYQQAEVGYLAIASPFLAADEVGATACRWLTQTLAYHLKRLEVARLARERHGLEVPLIGTSEMLSQVDVFLERASQSWLPALILGVPGSDAERIALALHLAGPAREKAFVQANCATLEDRSFERQLRNLLRHADGGTLLLARLDQMNGRSQLLLSQILETGLDRWAAAGRGRPMAVRLLATASPLIDGMVRHGTFRAGLLDQLDYLRLELEPLNRRREDIPPLIRYFVRRHAREAADSAKEIAAEVLQACIEYDWPGDVSELSRVAARLAVMTTDDRVELRHVRVHAPQILADQRSSPSSSAGSQTPEVVHPTLRRAIGYIAARPQANLSLTGVAASTYVSRYHLAHLFQREMGTTFTRFLTSLRVDRAKLLLLQQPQEAITAVAAAAGFADLRHFERTFKGRVGCTPREFRRLSGVSRQH